MKARWLTVEDMAESYFRQSDWPRFTAVIRSLIETEDRSRRRSARGFRCHAGGNA
jgi:hypothetical protein